LCGSSPWTCPAWEALPVAYATASIALGINYRRYCKANIHLSCLQKQSVPSS
jgi:hypothetical protein